MTRVLRKCSLFLLPACGNSCGPRRVTPAFIVAPLCPALSPTCRIASLSMISNLFFARVYVLKCHEEGMPPSPLAWFPSKFLKNGLEKAEKVRNRRNQFYKTTRAKYQLRRSEDGLVSGLFKAVQTTKTSAARDAEGQGNTFA